jgi:hypothetical protein
MGEEPKEPTRETVDLAYFVRRFLGWGNPTAGPLNHYWWETLWWTLRATIDDIILIQVQEEGMWDFMESERADRLKLERRVKELEKQIKAMSRGKR